MTIIHQDGTAVEAVLLAKNTDIIRAALKGREDVVEFNHANGVWVSEDLDPVQIRFEWEKRRPVEMVSESDCICSKELAARLIQWLETGELVAAVGHVAAGA
jgi:hypothetical protein